MNGYRQPLFLFKKMCTAFLTKIQNLSSDFTNLTFRLFFQFGRNTVGISLQAARGDEIL